jgi:hypothetical protein
MGHERGQVSVNVLEAALYIGLILICEFVQLRKGETRAQAIRDSACGVLLFLGFARRERPRFAEFAILAFAMFETISWFITGAGICTQVILSILDYRYVYLTRPEFYVYGGVAAIVTAIISQIRAPARFLWCTPMPLSLVRGTWFIMFFMFMRDIQHTMNPYEFRYNVMPTNPRVLPYFYTQKITLGRGPRVKKNLIVVHIECAEKRSLGIYNTQYPYLMPYLSWLVRNGTFFDNLTMHPDQQFTLASLFCQHAGCPLLGISYQFRGSMLMSRRIHTYSDFLHRAGYYQIASCTRYCNAYKLYERHHIIPRDMLGHGQDHDKGHFQYLTDELLPQLAADTSKHPFHLVIQNEDTYPTYYIDPDCAKSLPSNLPPALGSLQCFDRYLKEFIRKIRELGLDKTSEVFIYGDHLLFGAVHEFYPDPRQLIALFPFRQRKKISKEVTWYDVAPTFLEILGFREYRPRFPFGENMFGPDTVKAPTDLDRSYMNNLVHAD